MNRQRRDLSLKKNVLIILLLIFPLIKPSERALDVIFGQALGGFVYDFFVFWNYISVEIVLIMFLRNKFVLKKSVCPLTTIMTLLCIQLALSTISMGSTSINSLIYIFKTLINVLCLFLVADIYANKFRSFVCAVYVYITLLMLMNIATIYLFPHGMYASPGSTRDDYFLFGLDNMGFIYSLHGFFAGMIYYLDKKKKLPASFLLLYAFIFGTYVYRKSGTAIVAALECIIFLIIFKMKKPLRILNYSRTLIVSAVLYICVVVGQSLGIFTGIVEFLTGKTHSFNGRTTIWNAMFSVFPQRPITGFGIMPQTTQRYLYVGGGEDWLAGVGHLHNIVLEFLFKGGIIALLLFGLIWLGCRKTMKKNKNFVITAVLCWQLLISWSVCMFEFRLDTYTFWLIPIFMYNIQNIIGTRDFTRDGRVRKRKVRRCLR